jgi:hypothetical protein
MFAFIVADTLVIATFVVYFARLAAEQRRLTRQAESLRDNLARHQAAGSDLRRAA